METRQLLSAAISGTVMRDLTGNGMTGGDAPLSGVTVSLFRDVNNNGTLDAGDGAAVATTTSAGNGKYAFSGLAAGRYFVRESVPAGDDCTNPGANPVYTVFATGNNTYSGNDFDNYVETFTRSAVTNISYLINGTTTVTSPLQGKVHSGDTVKVTFTLSSPQVLTLVSYTAPSAPVAGQLPNQGQKIYQVATGFFCAGTHCLTVKVPPCYFQLDFVGGCAIDQFGAPGSNIFYSSQHRLIDTAVGGDHACTDGSCGCGCGDDEEKDKEKQCGDNQCGDENKGGDKCDQGKSDDSHGCGNSGDSKGSNCGNDEKDKGSNCGNGGDQGGKTCSSGNYGGGNKGGGKCS